MTPAMKALIDSHDRMEHSRDYAWKAHPLDRPELYLQFKRDEDVFHAAALAVVAEAKS